MKISDFIEKSGFKVLSLARLSSCEYSIVLYLLNCRASGLENLITTEMDFSSLLDYDSKEVSEAIFNLSSKKIIKEHRCKTSSTQVDSNPSMSLSFNFDVKHWQLKLKEIESFPDAVVYPFSREKKKFLDIIDGQSGKIDPMENVQKILALFHHHRGEISQNSDQEIQVTKMLLETYPFDYIVLILKHFKDRIQSLSSLASSWEHFQGLFLQESQKIDFQLARNQHLEIDKHLKKTAQIWLQDQEKYKLTEDEVAVLEIIKDHKHPRRQIFWAYQAKDQYKNLLPFFETHMKAMLPVTSQGIIVKKPQE